MLDDVRELQKPVEEAFMVCHGPGCGSGLALRMALASQVEAEVSVSDEPGAILRCLGQVKLGNGDSGDLLQQRGISALSEVEVAALLGRDVFGRVFRQAGNFAPTVQDGI